MAMLRDEKLIRRLMAACVESERKIRGTNIMGEEIESKTLRRLRAAITEAREWLGK